MTRMHAGARVGVCACVGQCVFMCVRACAREREGVCVARFGCGVCACLGGGADHFRTNLCESNIDAAGKSRQDSLPEIKYDEWHHHPQSKYHQPKLS